MIESGFINGDCMDYLKDYPDNYFDLCIADPPYGDGGAGSQAVQGLANGSTAINRGGGGTASRNITSATRHYAFGIRKKLKSYENRRNMGGEVRKKIIAWDVAPEKSFFDEIFRISRNQIIWGG